MIVEMRARALLVAIVLAACGDDGGAVSPDAGTTLDGEMPDGVTIGTASVLVTKDDQPVSGVRVYFQGADHSLIDAVDTDDAGMASAEVAPGAWVTVLAPYLASGQPWIETIGGVKPGDVIRFGAPQQLSVDLDVSIPKDPGAASYEVFANCHDEHASSVTVPDAETASFTFSAGSCPATIDFLVISRDDTGARHNVLFAPDQTPVNNAVAITGTYTSAMRTVTITYSNVPADAEQLTVRYQLASVGEPLVLFGDEVVFDTLPNQMASTTVTVPDGLQLDASGSLAVSVHASVRRPGNIQHIIDGLGPAAAEHDVDVGDALSGFASAPQYDPDAGTITWTESDAAPRDLAFAFLTQRRTVGAETITWYRTVVQPYTGAQITIPKLPVEDFDYNMTSADGGSIAEIAMATVPGGYDAIRARYFETFNPFAAPSLVDVGERTRLVEAR